MSRDDIVDYAAPAFLISSAVLVAALVARRRSRRLLDLQVRREAAASHRSSEPVLTATAPLPDPTPAPVSPETESLHSELRSVARGGLMVLVVWLTAYLLWANDLLLPWSGALALASSIAVLFVVRRAFFDTRFHRAQADLLASQARDAEAHLAAVGAKIHSTPVAPVLYCVRSLMTAAQRGVTAR